MAARSIGYDWQITMPEDRSRWIEESYLANFLYWRYQPVFQDGFGIGYIPATGQTMSFWQWIYVTYDNYVVWEIHQQEILATLDYIENTGARLIVLIFPVLTDPVGSVPYVDRVAQFLEAQGITEIMRLYHEVAYFGSIQSVVVSERDPHPNAAFHRYIGEEIYRRFFASDG